MSHSKNARIGLVSAAAAGISAFIAWRRSRLLLLRASRRWDEPHGVVRLGSLAMRRVGEQGQSILLLHGMCASNLYWGHFFDSLGDHHRLFVPDLLGFGRSPKPQNGYSAEHHAAAIAASLRECGVEERVLVIGHSMGAIAALALARFHPKLVAGVVAIAPLVYRTREDAKRHIGAMGPLERIMAFGPPAHMLWRVVRGHQVLAARFTTLLRPDLPLPLVRDAVQQIWISYAGSMEGLILDIRAPEWLSEIKVPVHLLAALDDPVTDIEFLSEITNIHQHVTLTVWTNGGHDLPLSRRERCFATVETLAGQLWACVGSGPSST